MYSKKIGFFIACDAGQAVCSNCKKMVDTTYRLRDVPLNDDNGVVKNILIGVCDVCAETVSMPQQSAAAVQKELQSRRESD